MPPMVGVPRFFWCAAGPSSRIDCPIWSAASRRMTIGPRSERQRERGQPGQQRAERDVLEDVERRPVRAEIVEQVVEHQAPVSPVRWRSTASSAAPRDPFSSTRSPARHDRPQPLARLGVVGGDDDALGRHARRHRARRARARAYGPIATSRSRRGRGGRAARAPRAPPRSRRRARASRPAPRGGAPPGSRRASASAAAIEAGLAL